METCKENLEVHHPLARTRQNLGVLYYDRQLFWNSIKKVIMAIDSR